MTFRQEKFCIIGIILFTLLINASGINWGIPSRERAKLIFENQVFLNAFLPLMKETRTEIRNTVISENSEYLSTYDDKQKLNVIVNGKELSLEKGTVNAMRTYLLRAYYPD